MERYKDKEWKSTNNPAYSTLIVSFNGLHKFTFLTYMIH